MKKVMKHTVNDKKDEKRILLFDNFLIFHNIRQVQRIFTCKLDWEINSNINVWYNNTKLIFCLFSSIFLFFLIETNFRANIFLLVVCCSKFSNDRTFFLPRECKGLFSNKDQLKWTLICSYCWFTTFFIIW